MGLKWVCVFKEYHKGRAWVLNNTTKGQKISLGQQMTNNRPNNQPTMGKEKENKIKYIYI